MKKTIRNFALIMASYAGLMGTSFADVQPVVIPSECDQCIKTFYDDLANSGSCHYEANLGSESCMNQAWKKMQDCLRNKKCPLPVDNS